MADVQTMGAVYDRAVRSVRDTPATEYGPEGRLIKVSGAWVVEESPAALAAQVPIDRSHYALARMARSEEGHTPPAHLLAVCSAALRRASRRGITPFALLTGRSGKVPTFGENAAGLWASTRLGATLRSVRAAEIAMTSPDFFGGADGFFSPRAQDGGRQGDHVLTRDAVQIVTEQAAEGQEWVGEISGIDPYGLMLFRRGARGAVQTAPALAVIMRGRQGSRVGDP